MLVAFALPLRSNAQPRCCTAASFPPRYRRRLHALFVVRDIPAHDLVDKAKRVCRVSNNEPSQAGRGCHEQLTGWGLAAPPRGTSAPPQARPNTVTEPRAWRRTSASARDTHVADVPYSQYNASIPMKMQL